MIDVTWKSYIEYIEEMAANIKNINKRFNKIVTINRGGLMIGLIFSHQLNIPLLVINKTKDDINYLRLKSIDQILLVDEISDSGYTLLEAKERLMKTFKIKEKNIFIVTIHIKPGTKCVPDLYYEEVNDWIKYPYETDIYKRDNTLIKE